MKYRIFALLAGLLLPSVAFAQTVTHPADVSLTAGQATQVADYSDGRKSIEILNTGSGDLRCAQGATATSTRGFPILPNGSWALNIGEGPEFAISCWTTAGTTVSVVSRFRQ